MEEKRIYKVFLSSVSLGLEKARQNVIQNMIMSGKYFPVAMEFFTADDNTIKMLYRRLEESDFFVYISSDRRGSVIKTGDLEVIYGLAKEKREIRYCLSNYLKSNNLKKEKLTYTDVERIFARSLNITELEFKFQRQTDVVKYKKKTPKESEHSHAVMLWNKKTNLWERIKESLEEKMESTDRRGWTKITSDPLYSVIFDTGILNLTSSGKEFSKKIEENLSNKDTKTLYMMHTTGKGFVHSNQELLADFVSRGGNIRFLCCMPDSDSLKDVAYVEADKTKVNRDSIHAEFREVVEDFARILSNAEEKRKERQRDCRIGTIQIANVYTLFRVTATFCEKKDSEKWGWITITLPPEKSIDMLSLEVSYSPRNTEKNAGSKNILKHTYEHFAKVWSMAEKRNGIFTITPQSNIDAICDTASGKAVRKYWESRFEEANRYSDECKRFREKSVLIEVAAQHPLVDGLYPGKEFAARLDTSLKIYQEYTSKEVLVNIYVPGSTHLNSRGVADKKSLSSAGVEYLLERGVRADDLIGDRLNEKYDGERNWKGVYNSGDECFTTAKYFKEKGFTDLICVCSPNQLMRKTLFYLENEIVPEIYTVPSDKMFHSFMYELFDAVPYVLNEDHNYQGTDSKEAIRTRKERMIGFDVE